MQTTHHPRVAPLDPNRIAAISGAIAVNGLLIALLVAPMSAPVVVDAVRETFIEVPAKKEKRVPPPPQPKPIRVPIARASVAPVQRQTPTPTVEPPLPQADTEPGDYVVPPSDGRPVVEPALQGGGVDDGKPLAGAHLEYAANPPPTYPREALLHGDEGTVMLEVLVDVDGRPLEVTISRSSGHRELDLAAKRQVLAHWRFKPALRNGQPVQAIGLVPVDFSQQ